MNPITEQDAAAMDDTAAWGAANVVRLPAGKVKPSNVDQCYTALQQSLAHYRAGGRPTHAQLERARHILRADFLKAEAAEMFEEHWEAYCTECYLDDGYRPNRHSATDVSGAMACWEKWDKEGHHLYGQLLHRAECAEIDAEKCQ